MHVINTILTKISQDSLHRDEDESSTDLSRKKARTAKRMVAMTCSQTTMTRALTPLEVTDSIKIMNTARNRQNNSFKARNKYALLASNPVNKHLVISILLSLNAYQCSSSSTFSFLFFFLGELVLIALQIATNVVLLLSHHHYSDECFKEVTWKTQAEDASLNVRLTIRCQNFEVELSTCWVW